MVEIPKLSRPAWADDAGRDECGVWASFWVGDAEQRMRWIEAGSFLMGSPLDEPGRLDREGPQHRVTITRGYWMAQTPCTQALWQAVMRSQPSRYASPLRPVENVSWHDAQLFLDRLERCVPGLGAALPSEAQWEYACRAGTTTSTHAGAIELLGECHAPVLDEIAWYAGNSGVEFDLASGYDSSEWPQMQYPHTRAGSRVVGHKRPNPWGLHDMLGNVWEWCSDRRRRYDASPVSDPIGDEGGKRGSRGGCWHSAARYGRAAFRYWHQPGVHSHYLGFRLIARG